MGTESGERKIDWSTAEVKDGALTLELTGDRSKRWDRRFDSVLALLGKDDGRWGKVRLTKTAIEVTEVSERSAGDLHHFLESVVLQVNSDLKDDSPEGAADAQSDPAQEADRAITATFRALADSPDG
jgi:hypothetical protein